MSIDIQDKGGQVAARDPNSDTPEHLLKDIAREEAAGVAYMFWGRIASLGTLALWVSLTFPFEQSRFYLLGIVVIMMLSAPTYVMAQHGIRNTTVAAFSLLLDACVLTFVLIVPPPFFEADWTPQLNFRLPNFLYFGIFLASVALSYAPLQVIWAGIASVAAWSLGFLWLVSRPGSVLSSELIDRTAVTQSTASVYLDPRYVSLSTWYNQIIFLVLLTGLLAVSVWRSRRLLRQQVALEAERTALSRYFSPNIVHELSTGSRKLGHPAIQPVAVLFADMVGYTAISEQLQPAALIDLLREFHRRLVQVTFAHGGTVDKYIGDAIMVTFGTPHSRSDDPVRALACAWSMIIDIQQWCADRVRAGEMPIEIGVGLHYGDVLVGNIGDERRLEYTVLGDAVNVASRLERLTRKLRRPLVVSDDLIRAVRNCGKDPSDLATGLYRDDVRVVRGRRRPILLWCAGGYRASTLTPSTTQPSGRRPVEPPVKGADSIPG